NLHQADERPRLEDVKDAKAEHGHDQEQRRVHGIASGHHADAAEHGDRGEDEEDCRLAALHRPRAAARRQLVGEGAGHWLASCPYWTAWAYSTSDTPTRSAPAEVPGLVSAPM